LLSLAECELPIFVFNKADGEDSGEIWEIIFGAIVVLSLIFRGKKRVLEGIWELHNRRWEDISNNMLL
jgi:hypothetical protein